MDNTEEFIRQQQREEFLRHPSRDQHANTVICPICIPADKSEC